MADSGGSFFISLVDHSEAILFFWIMVIFLLLVKTCYNIRQQASRNSNSFQFADQNGLRIPTMALDRKTKEVLPIFVYNKSQSFKEVPECAVCLSEFEENEKCRLLPNCNHSFHTECIDIWFSSHSTCPLCRTRVQPNTSPNAGITEEEEGIRRNNSFAEEPISSNITGSHTSIVYGHLMRGQTASSAVQYHNPSNIFLWDSQQGTSGGGILPQFALNMPDRPI